jgi:uncharacterized membrane protein
VQQDAEIQYYNISFYRLELTILASLLIVQIVVTDVAIATVAPFIAFSVGYSRFSLRCEYWVRFSIWICNRRHE